MRKFKIITKELLIPILISTGIFLFIESSYRFIRKLNINPSRINSSTLKFKEIAYDKKYNISEIKNMTFSKGFVDDLIYKPWIQIGNNNHSNKYSIVEGGIRLSSLSSIDCNKPIKIWFFGGSTTYGTGVSWEDTIPSQFVKEAEKYSICAKVTNYGVPYHFSLQEGIHFILQIQKKRDKLPDYVIFIDGLNDFLQIKSSIDQEPFFSNSLRNIFSINKVSWHKRNLDEPILKINLAFIDFLRYKFNPPKQIKSNYSFPENKTINSTSIEIANNMINNRKMIRRICEVYKLRCFHFLQPNPAIHNPRNYNETLSGLNDQKYTSLFSIGYSYLLKEEENKNYENFNIYDLSKIFLNYQGIPYIDPWHYSPRANKQISKKILDTLFLLDD